MIHLFSDNPARRVHIPRTSDLTRNQKIVVQYLFIGFIGAAMLHEGNAGTADYGFLGLAALCAHLSA